jgi:outer membrane lipopolysaccharide assembly protein LptE/RlpB
MKALPTMASRRRAEPRRGAACCAPSRQDVIPETPSPGKALSTFSYRLLTLRTLLLATALLFGGCGYHVAGTTSALPQSIHVIAVPAIENTTTSYRLEQRLTSATVHEFLAKTPYRVVSNANAGDAVLRGKILSLEAVPLLFDTKTARATTMLVTIKCQVSLTQSTTQKVLYHSDNFVFRSEYEISTDVASFFEEQDPALDRVAHDFATRLVAAVTENF